MINSPQSAGTFRHGLTFSGGLLLSGANFEDPGVKEVAGLLLTLAGVIWSVWEKARRGGGGGGGLTGSMPNAAVLLCGMGMAFLILGSGCARFRTVQRDISGQSDGSTRTIETTATATTFAAGKQALSAWKASQTDKSQTAAVGSVNQESDAAELMAGLMAVGRLAAAMQGIPLPAAPAPVPQTGSTPAGAPPTPPDAPAPQPAVRAAPPTTTAPQPAGRQ